MSSRPGEFLSSDGIISPRCPGPIVSARCKMVNACRSAVSSLSGVATVATSRPAVSSLDLNAS